VDRTYQLQFVSRVFMVVLTVAVISLVVSSILLWSHLYRPDMSSQTPLIASLLAIATMMLVELLVAIPLVFFLSLRQSHRIVGPMNRIKRILQAIGNGDFSQRITLRKGDALEDLAKEINQMSQELHRRFSGSSSSAPPTSAPSTSPSPSS
jgi:methyl-accepting chemotaxis protein